jgi:hypothetical protein
MDTTRQSIRRRLGRTIRNLRLLVDDALAWNGLHPHEQPLDCEQDRVALAIARKALEALEADRLADCTRLLRRLMRSMAPENEARE